MTIGEPNHKSILDSIAPVVPRYDAETSYKEFKVDTPFEIPNVVYTSKDMCIDRPFMPTIESGYTLGPPSYETEVDYKYEEDILLKEIKEYIDATYTQHYSGKTQATDFIIDAGHGDGFCIGSIMKYAKRYGRKAGYNRKDLMKIIHYAIIALHIHNLEHKDNGE